MFEAMRFWLRKGVDGFRVGASGVLAHDEQLRDEPPNEEADDSTPPAEKFRRVSTDSRPQALTWITHTRKVVGEFEDRLLAGGADTSS